MTVCVYLLDAVRKTDRPFDYTAGSDCPVGSIVTVPFGRANKPMNAVVTAVSDADADGLKRILTVSDTASLTPEMLDLAFFIREHTLCTLGDAVRCMIPPDALSRFVKRYSVNPDVSDTVFDPEADALVDFVRDRVSVTAQNVTDRLGESCAAMLPTLVKKGVLVCESIDREPSNVREEKIFSLAVTPDEAKAVLDSPLRGKNLRAMLDALIPGEKTADEIKSAGVPDPSQTGAALEKRGLVRVERRKIYRNPYLFAQTSPARPPEPIYSDEQREAIEKMSAMMDAGAGCAMLHGITGSGKTLVIKAMIDRCLDAGRGAIVLVPEIALTPQTVAVYCGYFGKRVAVMHSSLSAGERYDAWRRVRDGDCDVVIGTRSAVFAPVKKLGLIVIDEEQEHTYKSDTSPKYLAHDVARKRCADTKSLLILASATPSLASYYKAKAGIYKLVELKNRYGGARLPEVVTVDMRKEIVSGNTSVFSRELISRLSETKERGGQAILFLNRRGYNSVVTCRRCGENLKCPNCSVSLTYHATSKVEENAGEGYLSRRRQTGLLFCHYCGYRCSVPPRCPACADGNLLFMGTGTQRAAAELERMIPGIRVLRMDMDTTRRKFSHETLLTSFRNGEADVLLGTQMVTKGHDFPKVDLVGVLNADTSLYLDDYRAAERTFSMLTQVIGRAGRAGGNGVAVVQTTNPGSDVIKTAAVQDYPTFYEREIALRRAAQFPPFCDIVMLTVSSADDVVLARASVTLAETVKKKLTGEFSDVIATVYGPHEAPVYKVQNEYRMRLVIKCRLNARSRAMFASVQDEFSDKSRAVLAMDFNPSGM